MEKAAKAHLACTKIGGMEYDWDKYNKQPLPIRTAWAFWVGWAT
jgi:hypothetical protein